MVKNLPATQEIGVRYLGQSGRSPGKGNSNHSTIYAKRVPGMEEPGGLWSMGSQRVGHNWVTNTFSFYRQTNGGPKSLGDFSTVLIKLEKSQRWVQDLPCLLLLPLHHPDSNQCPLFWWCKMQKWWERRQKPLWSIYDVHHLDWISFSFK